VSDYMLDLITQTGPDINFEGGSGALPGQQVSEPWMTGLDLGAAWDARTSNEMAFVTGASVWGKRPGYGSIADADALFGQGTDAAQPVYVPSVVGLNGKGAIQWNGTSMFLITPSAAPWAFLHGSLAAGMSVFQVEFIDSTGPATQWTLGTGASASVVGMFEQMTTVALQTRVSNGSGTYVNNQAVTTAQHWARDTYRWRASTYKQGFKRSYVSGDARFTADSAQVPSASAPASPLRIGGNAGQYSKGYTAFLAVFLRELTALEIGTLGAWASTVWGVAA
jgi:hypothetical protein